MKRFILWSIAWLLLAAGSSPSMVCAAISDPANDSANAAANDPANAQTNAAGASDVCRAKGIDGLTNIESLPFLKSGVRIDYTGSIDKGGGNDDNSWHLYQDPATSEWVIFDVSGPGCLYQLYNHRGYPGFRSAPESKTVSPYNAPDTVYRFYFDGADKPQFTIKASEFGSLSGFEAPLTDMYLNWVKRTWFPMFFRNGCKITTSVKLETPPGGWGTVVYHSFADSEGVPTFQEYLPRLKDVKKTLTVTPGTDPKPVDGNTNRTVQAELAPGASQTLLDVQDCASIAEVSLTLTPYEPSFVEKIRVKLYFDDLTKPCIDVPFGAFFGNARGATETQMVMQGLQIQKSGEQYLSARGYNFFPMPFWKAARLEAVADKDLPETVKIQARLAIRPTDKINYPCSRCGYFRAAYREPYTQTDGADTQYASIRGTGHLVSGTFASQAVCEEDFRFYVDGCSTAKIESDGAESWAGFGWGFCGPYSAPLVCQDHRNGWMQTRNMIGDCYPFYNRIDVRQENLWHEVPWGWMNYKPAAERNYHGAVFYYGIDAPTLVQTDALDAGDPDSEKAHDYRSDGQVVSLTARYEGCTFEDNQYSGGFVPGELTDSGRNVKTGSEFTVAIRKDNEGVRLRRRSDQRQGRQRAQVWVDDVPVTERAWYRADRNPSLRWLEDEFEIPAKYTKGKDKIRVKLAFQPIAVCLPTPENPAPELPKDALAEGRFGKSLQGSAFAQKLACQLQSPKSEYTVDFWIRFPERKRNVQHIMLWSGFWDILTDNGFLVIRTDPALGKRDKDAETGNEKWTNVQYTALDAMIADGQWRHVALAENGQRLCLFVDGKKIFETSVERKRPFAQGGPLTVGYRDENMPFEGELDELRFTARFSDSVAVPASPVSLDGDTFALWRFDQPDGSDRFANEASKAPALTVSAKPPLFENRPQDAPADSWSEFYYWVFSYIPRP